MACVVWDGDRVVVGVGRMKACVTKAGVSIDLCPARVRTIMVEESAMVMTACHWNCFLVRIRCFIFIPVVRATLFVYGLQLSLLS